MDTNPVDALYERAAAHRVPMAEICRTAGIDPTTPSRWRRNRNGATVERLTRLSAALDTIIAKSPAKQAAAA